MNCSSVSKESKTTALQEVSTRTAMVDSVLIKFRVNYEQNKELPVGQAVHSDVVSVGGHQWRIDCYPRGSDAVDKGQYLSVFLKHMSKTRSTRAIFQLSLMHTDGTPSTAQKSASHKFSGERCGGDWGWKRFVRTTVVEGCVKDGHITFTCAVMAMNGDEASRPITMPPSNIATDFGRLLDHQDGTTTDVSFVVDGETIRAHRAVLAARSPVFRAELFGSMAEATSPSITIEEIKPATFRAMLRFMYTDELPGDDGIEGGSASAAAVEMIRDLLAAADRYGLERLKLLCAWKLSDELSADTVAATLVSAETYNCSELTNKCVDFLAVEEHFKKAAFTHDFALLVLKFPSIIAELKKRIVS